MMFVRFDEMETVDLLKQQETLRAREKALMVQGKKAQDPDLWIVQDDLMQISLELDRRK